MQWGNWSFHKPSVTHSLPQPMEMLNQKSKKLNKRVIRSRISGPCKVIHITRKSYIGDQSQAKTKLWIFHQRNQQGPLKCRPGIQQNDMVKFHRELIQRPKSQLYEPVHFEMLCYAMIYGVPTNCWKMLIHDQDLPLALQSGEQSASEWGYVAIVRIALTSTMQASLSAAWWNRRETMPLSLNSASSCPHQKPSASTRLSMAEKKIWKTFCFTSN